MLLILTNIISHAHAFMHAYICGHTLLTPHYLYQCEALTGRVHKILTWRWREPPQVEDELDHVTPHSPSKKQPIISERKQREYFVKWHEMSYWHCEWITELQVANKFTILSFIDPIYDNYIISNFIKYFY